MKKVDNNPKKKLTPQLIATIEQKMNSYMIMQGKTAHRTITDKKQDRI